MRGVAGPAWLVAAAAGASLLTYALGAAPPTPTPPPKAADAVGVLLVLPTPPVPLYGWARDVELRGVPALSGDSAVHSVRIVYPDCPLFGGRPDCTAPQHQSTAAACAGLVGAAWTPGKLEAAIAKELQALNKSAAARAIVIGVGVDPTTFTQSITQAHPAVSFVELALGPTVGGALCSAPLGGTGATRCVLPGGRGAYLNGVRAALVTGDARQTVTVLVPEARMPGGSQVSRDRIAAEADAFRQGVGDADPDCCVMQRSVVLNDTTAASPELTVAAISSQVSDMLRDGSDLVYSLLGPYDTAVAEVAQEWSNKDLGVWAMTSSWGGTAGATPFSWLGGTYIDWLAVLRATARWWHGGAASTGDLQDALRAAGHISKTRWELPKDYPALTLPPRAAADTNSSCPSGVKLSAALANLSSQALLLSAAVPAVNPSVNICAPRATSQKRSPAQNLANDCLRVQDHEASPQEDAQSVRIVGVGIYFHALGSVDLKAGSFYGDFAVYLHRSTTLYNSVSEAYSQLTACANDPSKQTCQCPDLPDNKWESWIPSDGTDAEAVRRFESLVNLVSIDRARLVTPVRKSSGALDYFRVLGSNYFSPDLSDWPMDKQEVRVVIEALRESVSDRPTTVFCHMSHYSGVAPSARYFPGLSMSSGQGVPWGARLSTNCWPFMQDPVNYHASCENKYESEWDNPDRSCTCLGAVRAASRYSFIIRFSRPKATSFVKTFLPPIFMAFITQSAWFIHPNSFKNRLGICGSTLVSSVLYHVSISSNMPDTSLLTWADRFMVIVYANNLTVFLCVLIQTILLQAGLVRCSSFAYRLTRSIGVPITLMSFAGPWVFSYLGGVLIWLLICAVLAITSTVLGLLVCGPGNMCYHDRFGLRARLAPLEARASAEEEMEQKAKRKKSAAAGSGLSTADAGTEPAGWAPFPTEQALQPPPPPPEPSQLPQQQQQSQRRRQPSQPSGTPQSFALRRDSAAPLVPALPLQATPTELPIVPKAPDEEGERPLE